MEKEVREFVGQKIKEHEDKLHKKPRMTFVPPTVEEIVGYIKDNPQLSNIDAEDFWKGYADGGWIDTQGNPVRNWKLKLRTRSSFEKKRQDGRTTKTKLLPIVGKICSKMDCGLPAVYKDSSGDYDHLYCTKHMPEEVRNLYE